MFALDGTPADCVYVALHAGTRALHHADQDLVVSGINRGMNLGQDVFYSGTIAAAREGALRGIPPLATSAHLSPLTAAGGGPSALAVRWETSWPRRVAKRRRAPAGPAPSVSTSPKDGAEAPLPAWTRASTTRSSTSATTRGRKYLWLGGPGVRHDHHDSGTDTADRLRPIKPSITPLIDRPKSAAEGFRDDLARGARCGQAGRSRTGCCEPLPRPCPPNDARPHAATVKRRVHDQARAPTSGEGSHAANTPACPMLPAMHAPWPPSTSAVRPCSRRAVAGHRLPPRTSPLLASPPATSTSCSTASPRGSSASTSTPSSRKKPIYRRRPRGAAQRELRPRPQAGEAAGHARTGRVGDPTAEYSREVLEMHRGSLREEARVVIMDDVLATGGTAKAAAELVHIQGGYVIAHAFVVELGFLGGRERLLPVRVESCMLHGRRGRPPARRGRRADVQESRGLRSGRARRRGRRRSHGRSRWIDHPSGGGVRGGTPRTGCAGALDAAAVASSRAEDGGAATGQAAPKT